MIKKRVTKSEKQLTDHHEKVVSFYRWFIGIVLSITFLLVSAVTFFVGRMFMVVVELEPVVTVQKEKNERFEGRITTLEADSKIFNDFRVASLAVRDNLTVKNPIP